MKNKTYPLILLALMLVFSTASCKKESLLSENEVPYEIDSYILTHFPTHKILQVIKDIDGFKKTYELVLDGNIKLEFNRKKEIIEIEGSSKLPDSVIPQKIREYVKTNFPNNFILEWELEKRTQKVGLDNDMDLIFKMDGSFVRIDD